MKFICFLLAAVFAATLDPAASISQFYNSFKNNVYYIEDLPQYDWFEALTTCARLNMSLATIESKQKFAEVSRLVKNTFGKNVILWVGGYAVGPSRNFTWIATGQEFTYTFWHGKNPDFNQNAEFCAQIGWGPDMSWNDNVCTNKYGLICEYFHPYDQDESSNAKSKSNNKDNAEWQVL